MIGNSDLVYDKVREIRRASGMIAKRSLLDPSMEYFLLYTYDPFRRYGMKDHRANGQGDQQIDLNGFLLLDSLADKSLSGHAAIRAVTEYVRLLTPKSAKLFHMMLNKDFKMGLAAKSINKEFPELIPEHPVMLAKLYNSGKVTWPAFVSPKIDGVRGIFRDGKMYTRNGHRIVGLSHIENALSSHGQDFDGELEIPYKTFQESSGLLRSDADTPTAVFHIFDVPTIQEPFYVRLTAMEDMGLRNDSLTLVPHVRTLSEDEAYKFYAACRHQGFEGAIIKSLDYMYAGKRSWDWQKMKNTSSLDLRVIDMFQGTGKYKNMMGGVVVKYRNQEVRVGSGFSDKERYMHWQEPRGIMGKIIEVLYQEVTPDGSLRHPRFAGIRKDKEIADG